MRHPGVLSCFLVTFSTLIFSNCTKTTTTTINNSDIAYKLQTINPSSILSGTTTANIQWTSGEGNATKIIFEATSNNKNVDHRSNISHHLNLLSGVTNVGEVSLPPATYDAVKFKVEFDGHGNYAAFQLNGEFTSGNNTTPVVFKVHNKLNIETEKNNIIVSLNNNYSAITSLNLSLVTKDVSETMLTSAVRTNGTIVISVNSNSNIYQVILNNLSDCDVLEFKDN